MQKFFLRSAFQSRFDAFNELNVSGNTSGGSNGINETELT